MRSSFKVLLVASLLPHILLPKDETTERAWNRIVPENSDDLLEIQARLQSLLPEVQGAVVSIEAQDGAGSGVIISKDGLVLTAAHVIGSSKKKMTVRLPNGERLPAISLGVPSFPTPVCSRSQNQVPGLLQRWLREEAFHWVIGVLASDTPVVLTRKGGSS